MGRCRRQVRLAPARVASAVTIALAVAMPAAAGGQPADQDESAGENSTGDTVRLARATWDTGWFQAEVYRQLIEELGYTVEPITTMENEDFYRDAAAGEVDLWVNGWFPLHESIIDELGVGDRLDVVGTQVDSGALQGYLVDLDSVDEHGVTSLADLADPELAARFDTSGDGKADLVGCSVGWGCEAGIEEHLNELDLRDTVNHVQGDYAPLIEDVVERHENGEPVLFYTWTPNWTVGQLVPGEDVAWIDVRSSGSTGAQDTTIDDVPGCVSDPCRLGWSPNDIRAVANSDFLDANPPIRRLLEAVEIPLEEISDQNARMRDGEGTPDDIRRHAREWISANHGAVTEWLDTADPERERDDDGDTSGATPWSPGGTPDANTLTVVTRSLSPFVVYDGGEYTGFSVELWEHVARRLGVDYEIEQVNSLAKQIDDVQRGAADVALGGLDINSAVANDLALSQPTLRSGLQIMVRNDEDTGIVSTLARIATSDLTIWIGWFVVIFGIILLAVGHVIWLLERNRNPDIPASYPRGIAEAIWWGVVAVTPFGAGNNTPSRNAGRVFAVGWILAGYFLLAYFTASITSTMAVDEIHGDITGPEDLAGHRIATVAETPGAEYLATLGVGPVLFDDLDEAAQALRDDEVDAVVFDAPAVRHYAARAGAGDVRAVGPVFQEFSYGLGTALDGDLNAYIDVALLELVENGVYETLYERWFGTSP
ncbi:proline/glycine betaine ABC transporter substrate-binding protein ProX [Actinobacteria bacterium YIM 96077]|uniref:Proline/glycine betaine ABC transporter substrate-binding protein ProX n=1 Tax=Phytoactinopolyspora halophila TaxID=1981511 RepID=A0A329QCC7_9ACTN|nr:glycine betaine/L-proline ABC transporter substrate-binding protein ProX [Phytoactinopolyspora halophila]AYY13926.1 proline/glycine betaine ABC transporter substrate-binding protein ProX [Actinobacteria bacterium YIM 96077]RAW10055.1 proline/glycine betaine ABC transporter substrate-binding protein ProX [Phytoactinopolyspora halophila]